MLEFGCEFEVELRCLIGGQPVRHLWENDPVIAVGLPIPWCLVARGSSDRQDSDQFLAHALRIDRGRAGSRVLKPKAELRCPVKVARFHRRSLGWRDSIADTIHAPSHADQRMGSRVSTGRPSFS